MSMAKKCDICGALYEAYGGNTSTPNGFSFEKMELKSDKVFKTLRTMDCCETCMTSIITFIKGLENNNKSS